MGTFFLPLLKSMPGAVAQGMIWGVMAIGVYITYRILDVADLTVDGSLATGGAVCVLLTLNGVNIWVTLLVSVLAGMLAGFLTGIFHTLCGIPPIFGGYLDSIGIILSESSDYGMGNRRRKSQSAGKRG